MKTLRTAAALLVLLVALLATLGCGSLAATSPPASPSTQASAAAEPTPSTAVPEASAPDAPGDQSSTPSASLSPTLGVPDAPGSTSVPASGGVLQVHYIDVGQGDSILIVSPEGKVMLIDGGNPGSPALEYLQARGITHVDLMVATHPHADHIGGLVDVLGALSVSEVVTNGAATTTATFEHFLDGISKDKALYKEATRGDRLSLGSLTFTVLSPTGPAAEDLNQASLVLRLVYGKVSFLFTGDAGHEAEAEMLAAKQDLSAQILKVGHHGSDSASSPEFLAAVHPEVAIYSCGNGNSYGHPAATTIDALTRAGAEIYGTDQNGTVVATSDGSTYKVDCERGEPRGPPSPTDTGEVSPSPAEPTTDVSPSASGPLSLKVVSLTSPASRGSTASLTMQTIAGADCTITVYYKSGPSKAAGLEPQTADETGSVTWDWKVGSRTTPGTWKIKLTASAGGETKTLQTSFVVR